MCSSDLSGDVLALIKSYHCGGETLGTVVKHSVRDSTRSEPLVYMIGKLILKAACFSRTVELEV